MKTFQYSTTQILTFAFLVVLLGIWVIKAINLDFFRYKNAANINPQMLAILVKQGDDLNKQTESLLDQSQVVISQGQMESREEAERSMQQLWEKTDFKTGIPKIPLSDSVSEYEMVMISPQATRFPSIGESYMLPLVNNQMVSARVESTTINANGDFSWRGHLAGFGNDYPVTMTYGENQIFATITTPQGSFSLETSYGLGWVYKNPAEPELTNSGTNDYALPKLDQ